MSVEKEFVPYEEALALQELGFDEPCFAVYFNTTQKLYFDKYINEFNKDVRTLAPTFSQAFRWFRDKKLCDGSVCRHGEADGSYSYRWDIVHEYGVYEERHFKLGYKTYEEAELACLIKLIEIVKQK